MNKEIVLTKLELLNKSCWFASDIQQYLQCSKKKAIKIKNIVAQQYGVIQEHTECNNQAVSTDNVIKCIGGNSRLEEITILKNTYEILGGMD